MLILCDEIQYKCKSLYSKYLNTMQNIVDWYKSVHENFALKLQNELKEGSYEKYQAIYEILAKEKILNNIEPLIRLSLAKFSYGPSQEFFSNNGFVLFKNDILERCSKKTWLEVEFDFAVLIEIFAHILEKTGMSYNFDLKVLASDRDQRNKMDHQGIRVQCLTLIRKYESVRGILVFLDPHNNNLPCFEKDIIFDYDRFVSEPCSFSFRETSTVLITDSVHDIENGYRSVIANLPWNMVIDFDGYSGFGGLLSSISHNRIRKELLIADKSFTISELDPLQTMWLRCGEYLLPHYHPTNIIYVLGKIPFAEEVKNFQKISQQALQNALVPVIKLQKFIHIVILSDDRRIANSTINALRNLNFEDYYLSWIGNSTSTIEEDYIDNEGTEFCERHFYHHQCTIRSFFEKFYLYSSNWTPRSSNKIDYALPVGSGSFVSVSENTRNNLSTYFEVLYKDYDKIECLNNVSTDPFQKGGQATWKDIATRNALTLDEEKERKLMEKIKSITVRAQEDCPQKNMFFIVHKAGIGGTTFVKQIAWKLHNDLAVLKVKRFDDHKTFQEIQNLYDNIIEKNPILIVAEDTLPNFEAMCDTFLVSMKNRRCALLIACRENSGLYSKYINDNVIKFSQLKTETIDALKMKFKSISTLSAAELRKKEEDFDTEVANDIRTPFIIGLYFLEKDFHIESYVKKVLNGPLLPKQKEIIALLAFCDVYDSKYLPSLSINKALDYDLQKRHSLIQSCPGVESLICHSIVDDIEVYSFKHKLLSEQYLKIYNEENNLNRFELAKKLIRFAAECQRVAEQSVMQAYVQERVIDNLLNILIKNKDRDINDMSQLLVDIAVPNSQRLLIQYLAEEFKSSADGLQNEIYGIVSEEFKQNAVNVLRLVSHAYAHLGKLWAKPPQENYEKAAQYLKLAEEYMPYDDPFIYHMHGNVLYHHLRNTWEDVSKYNNDSTEISSSIYEEKVDEAFRLFEKTCEFGDVQYGITGQLNLLFEYLRFIYKVNGVSTKEDLRNLTSKQISYQIRFIDVLDTAKQYDDFDENIINNIKSKENQLRSEVLMGDYGKIVEYYQNEYDKLRSTNDTDRALSALQGLISAKIQKAKEEYKMKDTKHKSFYHMIPNRQILFEQIGTLLPTLYNKKDYYSYSKRTSLFRHWFQLAKLLQCPINEAILKVDYWIASENEIKGKKNPEPYYYKAMLLCLERLEGGKCESEWQAMYQTISDMDIRQQFDPKRGRLDKIRDILVTGTGMGKLLDISDCSQAEDFAMRILAIKKIPTEFYGSVDSVQYWGAELLVHTPTALVNKKILTSIGRMSKNTISEGQLHHKVKFFAGFTVKGIKAVSDSVKDQDTGETFDTMSILSQMASNQDLPTDKPIIKQLQQLKTSQQNLHVRQTNLIKYKNDCKIQERKVFYPKYVKYSQDGSHKPLYLNGNIDNNMGGISIKYLTTIWGKNKIQAYGGIDYLLDMLIRKVGKIDVIVKTIKEKNGYSTYTLHLYDENIELSQLLQLQKGHCTLPESTLQVVKTVSLPNYNGKHVMFIPNDLTLSKTNGIFQIDGIEYAGILVNINNSKDKKKARKYQGKIPAIVLGKPQSGKYSLKMK